jgi:hypothetical protein
MDFNFDWDKLSEQAPAFNNYEKRSFEADKRFWKLARNENDEGNAIIRLLPDKTGKVPFVAIQAYSLPKMVGKTSKGTANYFLARNAPATINLEDPIKDYYDYLMSIGTKEAAEEAKNFKPKTKFYVNIKIIKDPLNKQNEGKVMLWEFSSVMRKKFEQWMSPSDDEIDLGAEPKQLFNPMTGCNILLKIRKDKTKNMYSYESSEVQTPTSIYKNTQDAIKDIKENCVDLTAEFLSPEYYDSYQVLEKDLDFYLAKRKEIEGISFKEVKPIKQTSTSHVNKAIQTGDPKVVKSVEDEIPFDVDTTSHTSSQTVDDDDFSFLN